MVNTQIRQLRDSIIAMTNASPLPIEVKRLVFAEIQSLIDSEAEKAIAAERQELQRQHQQRPRFRAYPQKRSPLRPCLYKRRMRLLSAQVPTSATI